MKNKIIDDCFISFVNMDHRTDRLKRMQATLGHLNLPAERTRGMRPEEYKGDRGRVAVMQNRTPGAIGCHFSQVSIMERAAAKGKHAWVMEDDLIFCQDFERRLGYIENWMWANEWDIFWLGATFHVNPPVWHKNGLGRDALQTKDPRIVRTFGAFCTYAYIVHKNALEKVLAGLDKELDHSIGIDYAMIRLQPFLQTFAFVPGCIIQYDNQSDIGKGRTIFSGFGKKLGPYWYQERMEHFEPSTFNWHEATAR